MNHFIPISDTPPKYGSIIQWLEHGTTGNPEAPAVYFVGTTLSYSELERSSNQVAHYLVTAGVQPGDNVGLCLNRSVEMIVALVGILKAGAAYVPLDPSYPSARLAMMVEDAELCCLLSHSAHIHLFEHALVWEKVAGESAAQPVGRVEVAVDPESAAYVIFTSGSTGRPKGIAMPHRALANLIEWQLERSSFRPGARVLQYSSISFDVSFQEIISTIASGGTLYLIDDNDRKDPRKLLGQLVEQRIERLFLPYVALRSLIEAAHVVGTYPEDLKETITAGEQLRIDDAVRNYFAKIDGATLDNQYGPSETHVITAHLLEGDPAQWPGVPSIGTVLKNCGTCILDEDMQQVSDGEEGELYLAGRNLAQGYVGRDDLTKKVFISNPFDMPGRPLLYKTGDLASYNPDGSIEFLGRRDHQIKVRGHRIEAGEINNSVSAFPSIGHCFTHAFSGADDALQLASYFTVQEGATVESPALRRHLADKLPEYMLPAFLIEISEIPYTPSGKVDLKSLPKPSIENSQYAGEEACYESEIESGLASIWSGLLGLEGIPRSADFFELGGDSLRAVTLFLKIQQRFDKDLPLASLANASTIAELAKLIEEKSDAPDLNGYRSLTMIQQGEEGVIPLFLVHGGMGNVLVYNTFAKNLGSRQPVYAFQWSGWDGYRGESKVLDMARVYKEELLRFLPEGPVRLGGYCIGGLIAIEMARLLELESKGIIYPLIVWDSPNLESMHYRKDEPWDSAETIKAFNDMKEELEAIRIETREDHGAPETSYVAPVGKAALIRKVPGLIQLLRTGKAFKKYLHGVPHQLKIISALMRGKPVPMECRATYCVKTMVRAIKQHKSIRYRGGMLYFRSDEVLARYIGEISGWWDDPFLGYAELCEGRFEAHAMGGRHVDILDIPEMSDIVRSTFQGFEKV